MKTTLTAALMALLVSTAAYSQGPTPPGVSDASSNTQCWDTLNNVSRDKHQGAGKLPATSDYQGTVSGSNEGRKVQGPGAEPKDETGVRQKRGGRAAEGACTASLPPAELLDRIDENTFLTPRL